MKFSNLREAKKMLMIDKNSLDLELEKHPGYFYAAAESYTEACERKDIAKYDMEIEASEADSRIREEMEKEGEKITEAKVLARVPKDKEYVSKKYIYNDLKRESNDWWNMQEAFKARGYMLKELCNLYCSNYYTTNSVSVVDSKDKIVEHRIKNRGTTRTKLEG